LLYPDHTIILLLVSGAGKSKNLRIFQEYYSMLLDCLPVKELSHYLVSHGVVTLMENEDITSPAASPRRAAELLLSIVSLALQDDNIVPFKKVLHVMQTHGNVAVVSLSREIQRQLDKGVVKINNCLHLHLSTMYTGMHVISVRSYIWTLSTMTLQNKMATIFGVVL